MKLIGNNLMLTRHCTRCDRTYPYPAFPYKIVRGRVQRGYVCRNCLNERGVCTGSWRANGNKMAIS